MSYSLESKKRKFDRILESLTERSTQPSSTSDSRASLNSRNNVPASTSVSRESLLTSSKKRRVTPTLSKSASQTSLLGHYLPSSRAAFLERLETFRHITKWHIPSTIPVNAAAWAKRGWICADVDTVSCPSCFERVKVDLSVSRTKVNNKENEDGAGGAAVEVATDAEDEEGLDAQVYNALVERYTKMIITSHTESCPWKKRGCDSSIQRIEGLLNIAHVLDSTRSRCKTIADKIDELPSVVDLPAYEELPAPNNEMLQQIEDKAPNLDAIKLAICGWQYKEADVVECKHCFRSLGLWLYRGATPTIENLDAIDSHLEYCPWRCPQAQSTELALKPASHKDGGKKTELPGWALVCHAIANYMQKKKKGVFTSNSTADDPGIQGEQLTPEQRENKMRDIMRRIKEIKKPFNVKNLLRKERSESR